MSRMTTQEFEEFAALTEIAERHAEDRKIMSMEKAYGVKWRDRFGLLQLDEFERKDDAESFGEIVEGEFVDISAIIGGRVIA